MRNNPGARTPVLGNEIEGALLFCRSSFIIRVNEDVGIEESTSGDESRLD